MPVNKFNLPITAIASWYAPDQVFFPEGTLLVDKDGISYRAIDYRPAHEEVGQGNRVATFEARQYLSVEYVDGSHNVRREFSVQQIKDLDIQVVWYPEENDSNLDIHVGGLFEEKEDGVDLKAEPLDPEWTCFVRCPHCSARSFACCDEHALEEMADHISKSHASEEQ